MVIQTKMIQNIHLCSGHICSIQTFLNEKKDSCCHESESSCCDVNEKDKNCCKDIVIEQNIDEVLIEKFSFECNHFIVLQNSVIKNFAFFSINKDLKINAFLIQSNAPPLFKLYQKYIFYA